MAGSELRVGGIFSLLAVALVCSVLLVGTGDAYDFFGPCNEVTSNCSTRSGAIVFGGFFPLHEWNYSNNSCSATFRPESGFQRLEAMRWAIEQFGSFGNVSVGYDLRDTCSKDTNTRDEALDFINVGTNCQKRFENRPISLVIGASSSTVSADLTSLLTLFDVPQISYAATSNALNVTKASDQARFLRFFRTLPPDRFQVEAMVDLLKEFDWRYVSVVYSSDLYGVQAFTSLQARATASLPAFQFCISAAFEIQLDANGDRYREALVELQKDRKRNASVVIVFAQAHIARKLFDQVKRNPTFPERTWIASDAWSGNVPTLLGHDFLNERVIGFQPYTPASKQFERHLATTSFSQFPNGTRRTWYKEYFDYLFPEGNYANKMASESPLFNLDAKVPFAIRAVEIGLQAVSKTLSVNCKSLSLCARAKSMTGALRGEKDQDFIKILQSSMFNTSFDPDFFVYNKSLTRSFHPVGDSSGWPRYEIRHYHGLSNTQMRFSTVGNWSGNGTVVLEQAFRRNYSSILSICQNDCSEGYIARPVNNFPEKCCWTCVKCKVNTFANPKLSRCESCPKDATSNAMRTNCTALRAEYLEWGNPLAIVMLILVILALAVTTLVVLVFAKQWTSSLVRASSRELSTCLFIGFYLGCIVTLLFITKPTTATCALRRFGLSFVLTICFSALLVKTNRISRVFNRPAGKARPAYVSPEWQILFTSGFVLVQVLILVVWLIVQPPASAQEVAKDNVRVQLKCRNGRSVGLYISLGYNLLLMILCTVYGVKTRKIPENFNEARYISFSMYTICTVWLGFIPAYLATSVEFEAGLLGLPLIINIVAMLGFLFVPKLYVILFDSERVTGRNILSKRQSRTASDPNRSGQRGRERSNAGDASRQASQ